MARQEDPGRTLAFPLLPSRHVNFPWHRLLPLPQGLLSSLGTRKGLDAASLRSFSLSTWAGDRRAEVAAAVSGFRCHVDSLREHDDRRRKTREKRRPMEGARFLDAILRSPLVLNVRGLIPRAAQLLKQINPENFPFLFPQSIPAPLPLPMHALPFARIASALAAATSTEGAGAAPPAAPRKGMSPEAVARRLEGIPVYTVCNNNNEFVLVSDLKGSKSVALFCFRQEDASALLTQVRERDPSLGRGARVAPVTLDKVYLLAAEGIAFRFLPDPQQVRHAIKIVQAQSGSASKGKGDSTAKRFYGVPIFQSENLILRSKNQRYIPAFFSKDDMDLALQHATRQKKRVNPKMGAQAAFQVQVGSLENALKELEDNEEDSVWGSLVFVPPGVDPQERISSKAQ